MRSGGRPACASPGREEVLPGDAPKNLPACPRRDSGREERRGGAMDCAVATARHLMQRAERQPPSRQAPVDLFDAERQDLAAARSASFKALDALAQSLDNRLGGGHFVSCGWAGQAICS